MVKEAHHKFVLKRAVDRHAKRQRLPPIGTETSLEESASTAQTTATTTSRQVVTDRTTEQVTTTAETTTRTRTQAEDTVTVPSTSSTSSSTSSTTSLSTVQTSQLVRGSSTSFVTNIITVGAPSSSASASAAPSSGGSGPSAGMVVGVVAGSLVGIVVIAGLLGYFFKTKFGSDKDDDIDDAVFNKSDFRHESIMLQDDDMDRMSMRSGSAAGTFNAAGVGRVAPGAVARNNAPMDPRAMYNASPVNAYHHDMAPPMPSFQPGQIVNTNFYNQPASHYAPSEGGWGVAAQYGQHLQPQYNQGLERQASSASAYPDNNAVSHDYPPLNGRSGSPINENVQQYYEQDRYSEVSQQQHQQHRGLSVRNQQRQQRGGAYEESAYDGI